MRITFRINGEEQQADCWEGESLLFALREKLGFPGSKNACEQGECGSCSVLYDGKLVCSCLVLAAQADGHDVTTVEGLATDGELHPVQQAFVDQDALQCGFCTSGQIMSAVAAVEQDVADVREFMSGNICRCAAYPNIVAAIEQVRRADASV